MIQFNMLKVIVPADQWGFMIYDQAAFNIYPHKFSDIRLHMFIHHAGTPADTVHICQFTRRYALLIFRPIFRYSHKCQYISYIILCIFFKRISVIIFINQYRICIPHCFDHTFRILKGFFAAFVLMSFEIGFPLCFLRFFHMFFQRFLKMIKYSLKNVDLYLQKQIYLSLLIFLLSRCFHAVIMQSSHLFPNHKFQNH